MIAIVADVLCQQSDYAFVFVYFEIWSTQYKSFHWWEEIFIITDHRTKVKKINWSNTYFEIFILASIYPLKIFFISRFQFICCKLLPYRAKRISLWWNQHQGVIGWLTPNRNNNCRHWRCGGQCVAPPNCDHIKVLTKS